MAPVELMQVFTATAAAADLNLAKYAVPAEALAGSPITYTLVFTNQGDLTAANVVITDVLPAGVLVDVAYASDSPALIDTGAAPPYVWNLPDLASGGRVAITVTGRLTDYLPTRLVITNTAVITSNTPDNNAADNTSSAAQVIQCPASYVVNTTADAGGGSLRQAVADVCAGGTVVFAPALTATGPVTITLASGAITITQPMTIAGPGANQLAVSGNHAGRILTIENGVAVIVSGLTLRDGVSSAGGGAVYNQGALTLHHVRLAYNSSTYAASDQGGGAIYSRGALTVSNGAFYSNTARYGGAIFCDGVSGGTCRLELGNVTFAGNTAALNGGALYNAGATGVRLTNVILWGNMALAGNQLYNNTTTPVINSSVVEGGDGGTGGDSGLSAFSSGSGNTADDPYLAAMSAGDLRLLPGSAAIDAGAGCPSDDLAGVARPQPVGGACDIGAHESQRFTVVASGGTGQQTIVGAAFARPLTLTVASAAGEPVVGGRVIFTGPVSGAGISATHITATVTASGAASVPITANTTAGAYSVVAAARGVDGVTIYTMTNLVGPTTATLAGAPNPAVFGQSVFFTATVAVNPPGVGTPTGVITFTRDASTLHVASLGANGVATVTTAGLAVGSHAIKAVYGGDPNYAPSTSQPMTQTINKATTSTSVTSSPNPSELGQTVTFTATIAVTAPGAGTPTGVVSFTVGGTVVTATVTGGAANFSTAGMVVGAHPVQAIYTGDGSFDASVSTVMTHTVTRAATAVTLINAPASTVYGQPVIFTATVTSTQKSIGMPTGTVTFTTGASVLGAVALDGGGVATFTTQAFAVGVQSILATYGGDSKFSVSASAAVTQTVNRAATATALVGVPAATIYGQAVSFTATVSIMPPGAGTLSGTVTFLNGATAVGTGAVGAGGVATLTTTALPAGSPAVTAVYAGNASFAASTSAPVTQTISKASTTMVLVTAPNPSPAQTNVVFTATLSVTPPGGGAPTGVVTYTAGSTVFTATLQDGVATGYLATLDVGTYAVSAVYAGDANFHGSNATAADQVVTCLPVAFVTNSADSGLGTLRRAIADACTAGRVEFNIATPVTITLTGGTLDLVRDVTISGPGPSAVSVSGNRLSRVFAIGSDVSASIAGLTIRDGRVTSPDNGGGIFSSGTLTLTNCALVNNSAGNNGGGVYNHASVLTVSSCTFSDNAAGNWGGGLATFNGTLTLKGSTFSGNGAGYWGGGVFVNYGAHALANSTFAGNSAGYSGGGIAVLNGAVSATNLTLVGNSANLGGGASNSGGALALRNSILTGSISGGNCAGAITNGGANLDSSATCGFGVASGSQSNIDPMLGALADYGSGAWTYALLPGSPAVDAGDPGGCAAAPVDGFDQRGVVRPQGAACDIGAFESHGFDLVIASGSPQTTSIGTAFVMPLQLTVSSSTGEPVGPGGLIVFTPPPDGAGLHPATPFTLTTDAGGVVSVTATANTVVGSYVVTATTRGALAPAFFELANVVDNFFVHTIGTGAGSLLSMPPGIACGITCTARFGVGAVVTLTAIPESSSIFDGWEGCDAVPAGEAVDSTGAPDCVVTVQPNNHVTATFTLNQYLIDVRAVPEGGGYVSGGGVYNHGFPVIVTASAYPGFGFVNWTENGLPVSVDTHYAFTATTARSLTANFTTAKPGVIAAGDAASVMTGESVDVPVLVNDIDQIGLGLTVLSIVQPLHGLAVIDIQDQTVRYLSPSSYRGVDRFSYVVQDGDGYTDTATVAVDVTSPRNAAAPAQIAKVNPSVQSSAHFTGSSALVTVAIPSGIYTGSLQTGDVLFLSFTPIVTPTEHTNRAPAGLRFANVEFELTLYLNDTPLPVAQFAAPITVTIRYDPQALAGVNLLTLQLYYWTGSAWSREGITPISHDVVQAILRVVVGHLSEFAFFGQNLPPTTNSLYLPVVLSAPSTDGQESNVPPVNAPSMDAPSEDAPSEDAPAGGTEPLSPGASDMPPPGLYLPMVGG